MTKLVSIEVERWPVAGAFTIARGAKTHVDVVVCTLGDGRHLGRGEGTAIYYHGETAESCAEAVRAYCASGGTLDHDSLLTGMARGAGRNALDCALWDLEAKRAGVPVHVLLGMEPPGPLPTAFTISLDEPAVMESHARTAAARGFVLLKCKLTGQGDRDRIAAVRQGAPDVRLIVDANESWNIAHVADAAREMAGLGVELVEQPVPAGQDAALAGLNAPVALCADESCQDRADMPRLAPYDAINIKLDKTGGLTEALALADMARAQGKRLMVGCMLSTSLGIAPAMLVALQADWVDLDGALLLARDREDAPRLEDGMLFPGSLWGQA